MLMGWCQAHVTGMQYIRIYFSLCKILFSLRKVNVHTPSINKHVHTHTHLKEAKHQGQSKCFQQKLIIKETQLYKAQEAKRKKQLDTICESGIILYLNLPFYLKYVILFLQVWVHRVKLKEQVYVHMLCLISKHSFPLN